MSPPTAIVIAWSLMWHLSGWSGQGSNRSVGRRHRLLRPGQRGSRLNGAGHRSCTEEALRPCSGRMPTDTADGSGIPPAATRGSGSPRRSGDAPVSLDGRIRDRDHGEEGTRIGVRRVVEERVAIGELDDPAEVHDRDAVAHVPNNAEIVADEDERQAALSLETPARDSGSVLAPTRRALMCSRPRSRAPGRGREHARC